MIEQMIVDQIGFIAKAGREAEKIILSHQAEVVFKQYLDSLMVKSPQLEKRQVVTKISTYLGLPVEASMMAEIHSPQGDVLLPVMVTMQFSVAKNESKPHIIELDVEG